MALVAWYPLINNLINNGVGTVTTSGTPTFSTGGKIGNCMTGNDITFNIPSMASSKVWSICFWGYAVSSQITSNWTLLVRVRDNGSHFRFEACPSSYANGIYCYSTHNNASYAICTGGMSAPTGGFYDQWCHVCVTSDGTTISGYYNGQLRSTWTYTGTGAITGIFDLTNNAKCKKNDLRIYDHCLSALEVKQISQALILHYPMTGGGRSCANLVADSYVNTTSSAYGFGVKSVNIIEGKTYTVSARGYISDAAVTSGTKLAVYFYKSDWSYCPAILQISTTSPSTKFATFTATQTTTLRITSYSFKSQGKAGDPVTCIWYKVEEENKPTPWMPHASDSTYTSMGYNDNTEYDVSGYLHNGAINGSVSYSSDSARYNVSTEFSKVGYINVPSFNVDTSAFTLNFWVKMKTATSQHFVLGTFNSWTGNGIGVYRDANAEWYSCVIRSTGESKYKSFLLYPTIDSWYMLTLTYDGTNYKGYLNGVLKQNVTYGSGGVVSNPVFMIGNSKYNSTPSSENEEAFVSDVRFYATALSADDIARLYNTAVSLSNNGTLLGYEFVEN